MQLTKYTDFALRTLMYVGVLPKGQLATISEISSRFEIPRNHLMKVVNQLARDGYLETVRGPKGGVRLAMTSSDIVVADVIQRFEVRVEPVNCDEPLCPASGSCALKGALGEAQQAFFNVLKQYTLAKLLHNPDAIIRLVDADQA